MGIREVAAEIKKWALANRMMGEYRVAPQVDMAVIRDVFGRVGIPAATGILQSRLVSYIGVNELKDEIVIFTKKKLGTGDSRQMMNAGYGQGSDRVTVTVMHSGIAHVGVPPAPPPGVPPFTLHNDLYTCGSSVYVGSKEGAGTLGCLVQDSGGVLYGLSNNHVTGGCNYAVPGLPIVAPGIADVVAGGKDPETIGHHSRAFPFVDGTPEVVDAAANLDAAIFKLADPSKVSSNQRTHFDTPSVSAPMEVSMRVEKVGRTTGLTRGEVVAELIGSDPVLYDIDMIGGRKVVYFNSMFTIKNDNINSTFSLPGDSGSLIVSAEPNHPKKAVGILVGGTPEGLTLALSIDRVLNYFGVTLISGHNA